MRIAWRHRAGRSRMERRSSTDARARAYFFRHPVPIELLATGAASPWMQRPAQSGRTTLTGVDGRLFDRRRGVGPSR